MSTFGKRTEGPVSRRTAARRPVGLVGSVLTIHGCNSVLVEDLCAGGAKAARTASAKSRAMKSFSVLASSKPSAGSVGPMAIIVAWRSTRRRAERRHSLALQLRRAA